jgi:thioredoxin reductase (NADPH)
MSENAMAKPVIMTVDDDPQVLSAIERDLRQRYQNDYRIVKAGSAKEALDAAQQLKQRGTPVALFLVDQRMPEMTGTALLAKVRGLHPEARKVLLTAYADTRAAIDSINEIGLDHYLMKPWDPPDQRLYPVLDDLLSEWRSHAHPPFDGIRIAGTTLEPQSYALRDFLSRNQIPYQWVDVDVDKSMRTLIEAMPGGVDRLPVVLFPDGSHLTNPTNTELAAKIGLQTEAQRPFYDLVVIGGGPAGLANTLYAASEGLKVVLVEQSGPGGQAGTSSLIENYLGFPNGITGADLAQRASAQARRFGAEIVSAQKVVGIRREDPYRIVQLEGGKEISAFAVCITTGMAVRTLDVPGVDGLNGRGVFYGAALSEAAAYRGREVAIVGGANSAGQASLFFSRYALRVTLLVRAPDIVPGMSHYLVQRVRATENINVVANVEVISVCGNSHLEQIVVRNIDTGDDTKLDAAAMFICIGTAPHSDFVAEMLDRDDKGFIVTGLDLPRANGKPRNWNLDRDPLLFETSIPGIFAAGDVRSGANRRVAAAVGEGSAAIYSIHRYLKTV